MACISHVGSVGPSVVVGWLVLRVRVRIRRAHVRSLRLIDSHLLLRNLILLAPYGTCIVLVQCTEKSVGRLMEGRLKVGSIEEGLFELAIIEFERVIGQRAFGMAGSEFDDVRAGQQQVFVFPLLPLDDGNRLQGGDHGRHGRLALQRADWIRGA